jgi:hypothetical protein
MPRMVDDELGLGFHEAESRDVVWMRDLKLKWEKTGREEVDEAAGRRGRMGDRGGGVERQGRGTG